MCIRIYQRRDTGVLKRLLKRATDTNCTVEQVESGD